MFFFIHNVSLLLLRSLPGNIFVTFAISILLPLLLSSPNVHFISPLLDPSSFHHSALTLFTLYPYPSLPLCLPLSLHLSVHSPAPFFHDTLPFSLLLFPSPSTPPPPHTHTPPLLCKIIHLQPE